MPNHPYRFGCWTQGVGEGGVSAVRTGKNESVVCAEPSVHSIRPWAPHMRNAMPHPKNDFEGIRSHIPTKLKHLNPKNICTREISLPTGSCSHSPLVNDVLALKRQPLWWDDSVDKVVCAFLPVGDQVAIGQVVTGQTLVSHDPSTVENRQGEPWESGHVDFVGRQTPPRADGIVVSASDVGKMRVPIVLWLVDDHGQHLGHS